MVHFTTDPGYDSVLAAQLEGKIVLIGAGNIVADTDLHTIGAGHPTIVSKLVKDPNPSIQLSAIVFLEINALDIFDIFTVYALRVSVQGIEGSKELGASSAVHLGMKE